MFVQKMILINLKIILLSAFRTIREFPDTVNKTKLKNLHFEFNLKHIIAYNEYIKPNEIILTNNPYNFIWHYENNIRNIIVIYAPRAV